jgi:hypothetical protein
MALLYQAAEQASWADTGSRNQCGLAVGEPTAASVDATFSAGEQPGPAL